MRQQLQQHLNTTLQPDGTLPTTDGDVPSGGTPLKDYVHKSKVINNILLAAKLRLSEHLLQVRVDLTGWSAAQAQRLSGLQTWIDHLAAVQSGIAAKVAP